MTYTICLTCVGGEMSPQLVQFLKASAAGPYTVVGTDMDEQAIGRHFVDRFERVPSGHDPGYAEAILNVAKRHRCDLVVPTSDEEALSLSASRQRFTDEGITVAVNDIDTLTLITDKAAFYRRLQQLGIAVPDWLAVGDLDALQDAVDVMVGRWGGAVVKPVRDRGGRGVTVIRDAAPTAGEGAREVHVTPDRFRASAGDRYPAPFELLVMRPLNEPVIDIDILGWQGAPVSLVARRRRSSALPNLGHTLVDDPALYDLAGQLVSALNLSWLLDLDVMLDDAGEIGILEVNPRPSGSSVIPMAAGVPLFTDMIDLARGRTVPPRPVPVGATVIPYKAVSRR